MLVSEGLSEFSGQGLPYLDSTLKSTRNSGLIPLGGELGIFEFFWRGFSSNRTASWIPGLFTWDIFGLGLSNVGPFYGRGAAWSLTKFKLCQQLCLGVHKFGTGS